MCSYFLQAHIGSSINSVINCNTQQGRTGGVQGNPVIKAEGFQISPVVGKTNNNCWITLLSSQDFPEHPLFGLALYPKRQLVHKPHIMKQDDMGKEGVKNNSVHSFKRKLVYMNGPIAFFFKFC